MLNHSTPLGKHFVGTFNPSLDVVRYNVGMPNKEPFGARVKRLRKSHKEKPIQADLAVAIGISRSTLAGIESQNAMPGRETMIALATYFGVSLDYLESGSVPAGYHLATNAPEQGESAEIVAIWDMLDAGQRQRIALTLIDMLKVNGKPIGHADRLLVKG